MVSGIVEQLPALIGVVIGAVASYAAGAATERSRWRRERSTRWDERRAQCYAEYGHAVKNVYVQCLRADRLRRAGPGADPAAYELALAELERLTGERTAKWEPVLLLGHPETIEAGRRWHRRVWQLELFARGTRADAGHWDSLNEDVNADRDLFYAAARRDLGITSGEIPHGGAWIPDSGQAAESSVTA